MHPNSVSDEIEAFQGRPNDPNEQTAFDRPYDFSCAVSVQYDEPTKETHTRGIFKMYPEGVTVDTTARRYEWSWDEICTMTMNAHQAKMFLVNGSVITIVGAVRAALLGAMYRMT